MACDAMIHIDGKPVAFRVSRFTSVKYRIIYRRSLERDLREIECAIQTHDGTSGNIAIPILQRFGNVAHLMASEADPGILRDPDGWYAGFETFDIYQVAPELISLWRSFKGTAAPADGDPDPDHGETRDRIVHTVERFTDRHRDVALRSVTVNPHMGADVPGQFIALVYPELMRRRGKKTTRETAAKYSAEMAVNIAAQCPEVQTLVIFWRAPKFGRINIKHTFERQDGKLIHQALGSMKEV